MEEVSKKRKATYRGGPKRTKKIVTSQGRLLEALWEKYGGPYEVARILNVNKFAPCNWRARGKIPLLYTELVANILKVPASVLNFEEYSLFDALNKKSKGWVELVKALKFSPETERYILAGKHPYQVKEVTK